MCCVIFGWLANQSYFKELTDVDVRGQMFTEQQNAIEADMAPFGFIDNGLDDPEGRNNSFFDDSGVNSGIPYLIIEAKTKNSYSYKYCERVET